MQYNESEYELAISKWFAELKDIVTNDLLWQHINKYPVKSDYEIESQSADGHKEQNENSIDSSSEERE